ncbi:hypothetical protein B0H14DRAFT_2574809 [Mycena olivaceomarginata]|nr:hypothetical protein B0H14DRAFT_2574809 [Mycena olivaceomarginata]
MPTAEGVPGRAHSETRGRDSQLRVPGRTESSRSGDQVWAPLIGRGWDFESRAALAPQASSRRVRGGRERQRMCGSSARRERRASGNAREGKHTLRRSQDRERARGGLCPEQARPRSPRRRPGRRRGREEARRGNTESEEGTCVAAVVPPLLQPDVHRVDARSRCRADVVRCRQDATASPLHAHIRQAKDGAAENGPAHTPAARGVREWARGTRLDHSRRQRAENGAPHSVAPAEGGAGGQLRGLHDSMGRAGAA